MSQHNLILENKKFDLIHKCVASTPNQTMCGKTIRQIKARKLAERL